MSYVFNESKGEVIRLSDNKVVSPVKDALDPNYLEFREWMANGGELLVDETSSFVQQNKINSFVAATQLKLDAFAKSRNYDGILSACTYATSGVPKFQTEGQHAVNCRDATWAKLYEILDEVTLGNRPIPSDFIEIESELPVLEWPE